MDIIEAHHKFGHAIEMRVVWEALEELENIATGESPYAKHVHKQRQCKREPKYTKVTADRPGESPFMDTRKWSLFRNSSNVVTLMVLICG